MPEAVGPEHAAHRSMAILYGTETGNSEEIAGELSKMAERLHFETVLDEMNSFSLVRIVSDPSTDWRLTCMPEGSPTVHPRRLRHVDHRTGGHAKGRIGAVEESVTAETTPGLSRLHEVHHLRSRRQLVSEVRVFLSLLYIPPD